MLKTDRKRRSTREKSQNKEHNESETKTRDEHKEKETTRGKKERGNDALDIPHYTNYTQPNVKGLDKERSLKMPGGAKKS